jgi:hypothetical protein
MYEHIKQNPKEHDLFISDKEWDLWLLDREKWQQELPHFASKEAMRKDRDQDNSDKIVKRKRK